MQALLEFWPVAAFYIAYKLSGDNFHTAVLVIMIAMAIHVAGTWAIKRTVTRMTLASAAMVEVLGGVSLLVQNDLVFMWKPTILNWLFAAIFLGSHHIGDKPIIQRLIGAIPDGQLSLSERDWRRLNLMWVAFFLISGAANIYVAYNFPESIWVNFKFFGLIGLTVVFVLAQAAWLARHAEDAAPAPPGPNERRD